MSNIEFHVIDGKSSACLVIQLFHLLVREQIALQIIQVCTEDKEKDTT
jgi:hypothetical protein